MKRLLLAAAFVSLAPIVHAGWTNNAPAISVLGKPDFTASLPNGPTATAMDNVEGVAIDPTSGKLFVADEGNSRILRFSSSAAYLSGSAAEAVLGQTDLESDLSGVTDANTVNSPRSLHVDASGRLWVADESNHRVLRFDNAAAKSDGANADGVLGKPDFTANTATSGASGMNAPAGVITDAAGRLWVTDTENNRVLRFDNAANKANGSPADGVLGQANLDDTAQNRGGAAGANTLFTPFGLSMDGNGRLWVADQGNKRILRFDNAAAKANGANADGVLGQVNFTLNDTLPTSASTFDYAYYITAAPDGIVWVGDFDNRRVLGFRNGAAKPNGAPADIVLGQSNFTDNSDLGPSNRSIGGASQIAPGKDGSILIGDYRFHRMLRFSPAIELKAPARVTARKGRATIRGTSAYASKVTYRIAGVKGVRKTAGPPSKWKAAVRGLEKPSTRLTFEAVAFDGRKATKKVVVKQ